MRSIVVLISLGFSCASCSLTYGSETVETVFINSAGKTIGTATLTQLKQGVRFEIRAQGLTPGPHGFHVHEKGECRPPDFKSAGEHFTFVKQRHGFDSPGGPHAGDLPNLIVSPDGSVEAEFVNTKLRLNKGIRSLLRKNGTTLIIHSKPDDHKSQPAGEAGDRIACAVVKKPAR